MKRAETDVFVQNTQFSAFFFVYLSVMTKMLFGSKIFLLVVKRRKKKTMIVAAHGNVDAYCAEHGMVIAERYEGDVAEYRGSCLVLVTDNCEDQNDYYYLKYLLRKRKVELLSTHWHSADVSEFVRYMSLREEEMRREKYVGRAPFGFRRVNGVVVVDETEIAVARKAVAMRDAGAKLREIAEEASRMSGRNVSISTIQMILKNRGKYE